MQNEEGQTHHAIQEAKGFVIASSTAQEYYFSTMTRKEFSAKSDALGRLIGWCVPTFLFLVLGLVVLGQFISVYIERHYHTNRWDTPGSILLLILMFGGLIGISCLEYRLARKWGLACPTCGRRFIDKIRRMVLLTGKCPKCKAGVFEDQTISAPLCSRPLNREEFKTEFENFTRQWNRKSIRLLIIVMAAMFGTVPVSKYIQHLVDKSALDWVTLTEWKLFAGIMLASVFLSFSSIFIFAAMGKFKLRDLPCPECNRPLIGNAGKVALETGICVYCGCRLFEEPSSGKVRSSALSGNSGNNLRFWG